MRPPIPDNHPDYSKTVRRMSSAEWHNIWLFAIYAIIFASAIGMAKYLVSIDRNLEKLVIIQQQAATNNPPALININTK